MTGSGFHDTRNVRKGDLFVAIVGKKYDGHVFLKEAARRGAKGAVVSRLMAGVAIPQIDGGRHHEGPGRVGKGPAVGMDRPGGGDYGQYGEDNGQGHGGPSCWVESMRVLKTEGNLNNQWGLPLTLLKLEAGHQVAVVELGINHPGEMGWLSEIARPDVAVVTAIGDAHLGFFKNRRHLATEKLRRSAASLRRRRRPSGFKRGRHFV